MLLMMSVRNDKKKYFSIKGMQFPQPISAAPLPLWTPLTPAQNFRKAEKIPHAENLRRVNGSNQSLAIFGNSSQNLRILWKLKPKLKNFMETQAQILPKTQYFGKSSLLQCPKSGQKTLH